MEINLLKYNRHWEKGFVYPYPKKRLAFPKLVSYLNHRQIIEITGLRRVGKSTLLFQLINHLKKMAVNPYHILYFTFDELQPKIESLIRQFQEQMQIDYTKEKLFVFLDEIQKLPQFPNQIKVYYDLYPNIKFFLSGSTSLFIRKKTQESLAGRVISFFLKPLSFPEYLMFVNKEELIQKPKLYQSSIASEFKRFLHSQFIESIRLKTGAEKKEYFSSIIKKVIYEDLPFLFRFDNPHLLFRLVQYMAQKPGCLVNHLHLAEEFGVSNKTISLYLSYLEDSLLVKKFYNFSRNIISNEKRLKKYFLASPSFSSALVDFSDYGSLFENYIASLSDASYFWRDAYSHEVDFISVNTDGKIFPYEVKYRSAIKSADVRNLFLFLNAFAVPEGAVLYHGIEKQMIKKEAKIVSLIPFFQWT